MRKIVFIFSVMLFGFCTLIAQGQNYTVTWMVNGMVFLVNETENGNINIEFDDPYIEGNRVFAGWTSYESYSNYDAPDDLFDYFSDSEDLPIIEANSTFYAVFAELDNDEEYFNYTTDNLEDLIFISNDTVISLDDAKMGKILFIKNQDEHIRDILKGSETFSPDWGTVKPIYNYSDSGTYLTITSPGDYWINISTIQDWRYRQITDKKISFKVREYCTVKYDNFDDKWCPENSSVGGKYKLGSPFQVSPSSPNDPEGLNRKLINWNSEEDGKGKTYQIGEHITINDDITLYPQWEWEINTTYTAIDNLENTDVFLNSFGNLIIGEKSKVIIKSLTLQGGLDFEKGGYSMPSLYITKHDRTALQKNNIGDTVDFNISIDNSNYYPFAVPFPVAVSDIDYADTDLAKTSEYGRHYVIKTYDGAARAENGISNANNWTIVEESATLHPGIGYIMTAIPIDGKAVIRIPLHFDDKWTKKGEKADIGDGLNREEVSVSAHSGTAANAYPIHAGWNFIANPYLAKYDGSNINDAPEYASIPRYDFSAYDQVLLDTTTLSPEYPFFVQVGSDATLNFATTGRRQAPASLRSTTNTTLQATLSLTPQDDQTADHTTILINDTYTPAYEINADLEKMFGSAYTTALYTLSQEHRLAYNALSPQDAITPIPLGFRAAQEGEYTITLKNLNDLDNIESVNLFDAHTNQTINLLHFDYTFTTTRTQDDARFTVNFVSRSNTATNITDIPSPTTSTTKFIHNNQLYILKHGNIYNAQGQQIQ
ncbi:MAG: hypothetical protein IJ989_02680 [Paludibacteraceae bacterium]|nr:hypothetical protein [Paludibacteraceae bacterium]